MKFKINFLWALALVSLVLASDNIDKKNENSMLNPKTNGRSIYDAYYKSFFGSYEKDYYKYVKKYYKHLYYPYNYGYYYYPVVYRTYGYDYKPREYKYKKTNYGYVPY
ncbi:unnamed protein product [Brachionus calyciflorus]|uniref:Uncharacterized protein n=1 Tax=Brachionus calyciflorus TaxID=104777 RepID=A0A813M5Y3_9BILA|nr:unnamed protein product [Brachionus calyciflorus]